MRQIPHTVLVGVLLVAGLFVGMPWRLVDTDTLSRMAVGRYLAQHRSVPRSDPFTFTAPEKRWNDPELVGDLGWYGAYRAGGDIGVVALQGMLGALGLILAFVLALRRGGTGLLAAAVFALCLPAVAPDLHARNALHMQWLIPLLSLLVSGPHLSRRRLTLAGAVVALWANLHSSFVLAAVIIFAEWIERRLERRSEPHSSGSGLGWLLLALPLLTFLNVRGIYLYEQLWDHLMGAPIYRHLLLEWQPSASAAGGLTKLPLHLMGIIGPLSFLPAMNRRRVGAFVRVIAALALAYGSQRFVSLLLVMAAPDIAANFRRWSDNRLPGRRQSLLVKGVAASLLISGLGATAWGHAHDRTPNLWDRPDAPLTAARFVADTAPAGVHLFNPYNAGPYLLWQAGDHARLFIDPRNNLGANALHAYMVDLLPHPGQFAAMARSKRIDLAMIDLGDGNFSPLATFLDNDSEWPVVFHGGRFVIYASQENSQFREWISSHAYHVIRGTLSCDYLLSKPQHLLDADLWHLENDAPALASVVRGYLLVARNCPPLPRAQSKIETSTCRALLDQATRLFEQGMPKLPPSPAFLSYLGSAYARQGRAEATHQVLAVLEHLFPNSTYTIALANGLRR